MVRMSALVLGLMACEDTDTKVEDADGEVITDAWS